MALQHVCVNSQRHGVTRRDPPSRQLDVGRMQLDAMVDASVADEMASQTAKVASAASHVEEGVPWDGGKGSHYIHGK